MMVRLPQTYMPNENWKNRSFLKLIRWLALYLLKPVMGDELFHQSPSFPFDFLARPFSSFRIRSDPLWTFSKTGNCPTPQLTPHTYSLVHACMPTCLQQSMWHWHGTWIWHFLGASAFSSSSLLPSHTRRSASSSNFRATGQVNAAFEERSPETSVCLCRYCHYARSSPPNPSSQSGSGSAISTPRNPLPLNLGCVLFQIASAFTQILAVT